MSTASDVADRLQVLRTQLAAAATPSEHVKAALLLAEDLWLSDPSAADSLFEQVISEAGAAGEMKFGARAASMLSELRRRAGDLDGSVRYAELVLKAADVTSDARIRASGLNLMGMVHQERGLYQQALADFEQCLNISRETGFAQGEQSALNQLAGIYGLRGQPEKALACYRQCLEMSERTEDAYGRAIHLYNVGWTQESMGRWTEAVEHLHRAIALSEEHGFRDLLLAARIALGEMSVKRCDYETAALRFSSVVVAERESHNSGRLLREALANLGWAHFRAGNLASAENTLDEAAQLGKTACDRRLLANLSRRQAELAIVQGRLVAAEELLADAERHATELGLQRERGEVLRVKGLLSVARAESSQALQLFDRSETTLESLGDTYELALTRLQRGRLLMELGRPKPALLQAAARTFHRLSVVAEAEEAGRLLYRLEVQADRATALAQALSSLTSLGLSPERHIEKALLILCDNLRFEQGAILAGGRSVALRGQPDLARLPKRSASLSQTDSALFLPVRQGRRLLGYVWLGRSQPLATRVEPEQLDLVSRILAPSLVKMGELSTTEAGCVPQIPGLRFRGVVGCNPEVLDVLRQVPRAASATMPVLVQGETGTGKELVARALHESGPRADHPFVTVNCAAVPESLLEAEFFGVEAGAATGVAARPGKFELAHTGTIFLDEIGDMSPALQAKLLRVIEDKQVTRVGGSRETPIDVWVIAATNMDLDRRRSEGGFREDLLYRLNGFRFTLPPLRRRREDMLSLTNYFIARAAHEHNRSVCRASRGVVALFAGYSWPGNIRQLQHVVFRAVILATGDTIEVCDLPPELRESQATSRALPDTGISRARRLAADEAERAMLLAALADAGGKAAAARKLTGFSRTHFYRLLRKHHIADSDNID
jgi:DNA-binding NtrC family response regulator/tetratricopeptide (TPR) repeat protein